MRDELSISPPVIVNPQQNKEFKGVLTTLQGEELNDVGIAGKNTAKALTVLASSIQNNSMKLPTMYRAFRIMNEEVNILWWLFGERSYSTNEPFATISSGAAVLVGAFDLAELTEFSPGPFKADAFLEKMISIAKEKQRKKFTVAETVDKCQIALAKMILDRFGELNFIDLCPIHGCISEFARADGEEYWKSAAVKTTSVDVTKSLSRIEIAVQAYQEGLMLRTLQDL